MVLRTNNCVVSYLANQISPLTKLSQSTPETNSAKPYDSIMFNISSHKNLSNSVIK